MDAGAIAPDAAAPPLGGVSGRVTSGGSAVPGARIRFGTAGHTREAVSDPQGAFRYDAVPQGAYAIAVEVPGRSLGAFQAIDVGLGAGPTESQVTLEVLPTAVITGFIRDDVGKPLPGAVVTIEEEDRPLPVALETGADGRFTAQGRIRGRIYRVSIRRAGFLPDGPRQVRAGGAPLELGMRRGAILEGLVVDEAGLPIAAAEIAIVGEEGGGEALLMSPAMGKERWPELEPSGELGILRGGIPYPPIASVSVLPSTRVAATTQLPHSDGKGQFRVAELPAGVLRVVARHPDFAEATSVAVEVSAGTTKSVRIELRRGATVRGRVTDEAGKGVGDAQITSSDGRTALSDAAGAFQLEHVVRRTQLTARHAGYLRAEGFAEPGPGQREVVVELSLHRAVGRLGGEVLDASGRPVPGARISITPRDGEGVKVTSLSNGSFRAEGLAPGPYKVVVEHVDYARLLLPAIEASDGARLLVRYGGGVDGELFDPRTGSAPADVRLELVIGDDRRAVPLVGRRFSATGVPSGRARLVATAHGYPTLAAEVDITEGDRPQETTVRDLRLEMELGGQLRGRVRDDHGDPVIGADIDLPTHPSAPVRSDSRGEFTWSGAPTGSVRVRARFHDQATEEVTEVRSNEESRVDLTLR